MTSSEDPRRQRPIEVKWVGEMAKSKRGSILIDGEVWAYAHWSQGRQVWCIQDAEGECQVHVYAEVKGRDNRSTAVTLAEAMIRGGSLPSPEELTARRERETQQRRKQTAEYERRSKLTAAERAAAYEASLSQTPSAVRARAERREREERSNQLRDQKWAAERRDVQAAPLWMALADAFDFADPNLWRSNSFASLRPRLVLYLQRVVAKLEYDMHEAGKRQKRWGRPAEPVEL
jgi:hypothetical protein